MRHNRFLLCDTTDNRNAIITILILTKNTNTRRHTHTPMKAILQRYYGDYNVTKSHFTLLTNDDKVLLQCEARELRYVDWENEKQPGSSYWCMPRGEFELRVASDPGNPLCYRVCGAVGHRSTKVCVDLASHDDRRFNRILLGFSDGNPDPSQRNLCDKERCRDMLYQAVREGIVRGEEVRMVVENQTLPLAPLKP
ncbi:MAG: hypothetical protein KBT29_04615 [Prevotellaceae bacterium]|nr:hypothetical protein [Candidatus Minthosoma caballi]